VVLAIGLCAAFGFFVALLCLVVQTLRLPWHVRWDVEQPGIFQLLQAPMSYPEKLDAKGLEIHKSAVACGWVALALFVTMIAALFLPAALA
jgi:hypothetical protein